MKSRKPATQTEWPVSFCGPRGTGAANQFVSGAARIASVVAEAAGVASNCVAFPNLPSRLRART
jgi:hypothetical protein